MTLIYDPSVTIGYGLWVCPRCGARFYGGGRALHINDCPDAPRGYDACEYHFGDEEVRRGIRRAASLGEDYPHMVGSLSMRQVREQFPDVVAKIEAEMDGARARAQDSAPRGGEGD